MILIVLLLPLIGSLTSGLLGRLLGYNSSKYIATLGIIIPCIISWYLYYSVIILNNIYTINLFNWITIDNIEIDCIYYWWIIYYIISCCLYYIFISSCLCYKLYESWSSSTTFL